MKRASPIRPTVITEKITVTDLNGPSISRCQHGSLWTEKFGPVYCESCMPGASNRMSGVEARQEAERFVTPHHFVETTPHEFYANPTSNHGSPDLCPKCKCAYHEELEGGRWRCADCN